MSTSERTERAGEPLRTAWLTFGCRVNQYDTQAGRERFEARGATSIEEQAESEADARALVDELGDGASGRPDVIVVNTCTITARAAARGRQALRAAKRRFPDAQVVATGCHARLEPEALADMPEVDHVLADVTRDSLDRLLPAPENREMPEAPGISRFEGRHRPFVKVQEGCDAHCTYCIVPTTRGDVRSRPVDEVVAEVERLVANGYREVVLAGIHVGGYGRDESPGAARDLATLLSSVHDRVPSLSRLRLSSIEPFEFTDELIETLAGMERFAPHLHIPLQHADDAVLKVMNRRYRLADYARLVERLRNALDAPGISTDVITGFPTEDDRAHENLVAALADLAFDRVHVFPFSPRPGTPAATLHERQQLDGRAVAERRRELLTVASEVALRAHERRVGCVEDVLLEEVVEGTTAGGTTAKAGYSARYHRVHVPPEAGARGEIVRVAIDGAVRAPRPGDVPHLVGAPLEASNSLLTSVEVRA